MATDVNDKVTAQLPLPLPAQGKDKPKPPATPKISPVEEFTMHEPPPQVDPLLLTILGWPRAHNSPSEKSFNEWLQRYITSLGVEVAVKGTGDLATITCSVPTAGGKDSDTLFACHVDTRDNYSTAPIETRKQLVYDPNFGHVFLDKENKIGNCLGADDGVGVWILLRMIEAGVPGSYVFNRCEENGGRGAEMMRRDHHAWLRKFNVCVEFDRPRYDEIITHQRGKSRCASDKFGHALAKAFNEKNENFSFRVSDEGVYTDNYDWRDVIAECVNVAVGYEGQHTTSERLDYGHAEALLKAALEINWAALPVDREPEKTQSVWAKAPRGGYKGYAGGYWQGDDDTEAYWQAVYGDGQSKWTAKGSMASNVKPLHKPKGGKKSDKPVVPTTHIEDEVLALDYETVQEFCAYSDDKAARLMIEMAAECRALRSMVASLKKYIGN